MSSIGPYIVAYTYAENAPKYAFGNPKVQGGPKKTGPV